MQTVFIRNDDQYEKIILDFVNDLKSNIVPFFGAGISFDSPSNLPLASHLSNPLIKMLWNVAELALKEIDIHTDEIALAKKSFERIR
jgi:hypothetical protein